MTPLTLAAKNVRHQARTYTAFFLSSTFAVWVFYLYSSLLAHPQFQAAAVGSAIRLPLQIGEAIVALFAMLFLWFSHAAFLKAREPELAVLMLLGMQPREIARTLYAEIACVGLGALAALAVGTGLGLLLSQLFFLGIGQILGLAEPLAFTVAPLALVLTWALFGAIFALLGRYTLARVRRTPLSDLLRSGPKPAAPPANSPGLLALCTGALGLAYGLALTATPDQIGRRVGWIVTLLLLATYLLFTQSSLFLLRLLRRRPRFYLRGANLLTVSQLAYKVRENARTLFLVTLLTTLMLFAATTFYSAQYTLEQQALAHQPLGLMIVRMGGDPGPDQVEPILREQGVTVAGRAALTLVTGQLANHQPADVQFAALSDVNRWLASLQRGDSLWVEPGHALSMGLGGLGPAGAQVLVGGHPALVLKDSGRAMADGGERPLRAFNDHPLTERVLVVSDGDFAVLRSLAGPAETVRADGYRLSDWKGAGEAIRRLEQVFTAAGEPGAVTATGAIHRSLVQNNRMLLFLSCFAGALFFLATANTLYLRVFTDLGTDRLQFRALYKLGVGPAEVRAVLSAQTLVLFAAPLAVALLHTAVALVMLRPLFGGSIPWAPSAAVAAAYLVLYGAYWLATRRLYVRAVLSPS